MFYCLFYIIIYLISTIDGLTYNYIGKRWFVQFVIFISNTSLN